MAKGGQFEMAKLGYFNMGERGQLSWVFQSDKVDRISLVIPLPGEQLICSGVAL